MKTIFISVIGFFIMPVLSSPGDRSMIYQSCLGKCVQNNCTDVTAFKAHNIHYQDFWCKLLSWSCREECSYVCMWYTVEKFQSRGETIPKFHGKWPFTRIMGMQEPAAAFSSILNLAANFYMYKKIRREFPVYNSSGTHIVMFWHVFAMVCMNAWLWSTIFHMRDTPFTEFMDYACALSMVMGLFVASIVRLCHRRPRVTIALLVVPLVYFVNHVRYLYSGAINYDYNMKMNVFCGVLGSALWLFLSYLQLGAGLRYARYMLLFTCLSGAALALELLDFPPLADTWDAHALWHLTTSPLPLLFYQYVIEDLRYLQSKELEKFAFKLT